MKGKKVTLLGGGRIAERRVRKLVSYGARVVAAAQQFTPFFSSGPTSKNLTLMYLDLSRDTDQIESLLRTSTLAFIATNDHILNRKLARLAKSVKVPVNVADNPQLSDFFVPAITKIGDIQIAISTGGKSPLIAGALRKRIEKMISPLDLNQVALQNYARLVAKRHISDTEKRKKFLHQLLENTRIRNFLKDGKVSEARRLVYRLAKSQKDNC